MNSNDLCMIEYIPELIESGISSFKIEGRMKSSYYVASVVKAYREAIDAYYEQGENYKFNPKWLEDVSKSSHREFSTGFYFGKPEKQIYNSSSYIRTHDIVGLVIDYDKENNIATIEQRNRVFKGEEVEVLTSKGENFKLVLENMWNQEGEEIESAPHPQMIYKIRTQQQLKPFDMLVKEKGD